MNRKVVLILADGMRPDALAACDNIHVAQLLKDSTYTLSARTVMPSVTLPCHMSLFHSVDPERHGILTNTYVPQVRPVNGLIELLHQAGRKCAFFYSWEPLRDLARPGHLAHALYIDLHQEEHSDKQLTDAAISYILKEFPDFTFLYLGQTDDSGHRSGWMSDEYLQTVSSAIDCARRMRHEIPAEYDIILTADHGGHARIHGTEAEEDMTIPVICQGPSFQRGCEMAQVSILDIAPTIARILNVHSDSEWEGTSFLHT